jgi:hypothetical protein
MMNVASLSLGAILHVLAVIVATAGQEAALRFGFQVKVTLSPRATEVLRLRSEQVVVATNYFGFPDFAHRKDGGEMGEINLAPRQEARLPASGGIAEIKGSGVATERFDWLQDRRPQVLVNVVSARLSSPDNLLNCDVFEGPLARAQKEPVAIYCTLIEEQHSPRISH